MSDAGSKSTIQVNIDSDSDEDSASMFEQKVKRCFDAPGEPPSSEAATESASTMQQAYVAGAGETEPAKAADAAKATDLPEAPADKNPPPPPKKKRPYEKGQSSKAVNNKVDALADIFLTPINEMMAAEDLEKLRTEIVKQASQLH